MGLEDQVLVNVKEEENGTLKISPFKPPLETISAKNEESENPDSQAPISPKNPISPKGRGTGRGRGGSPSPSLRKVREKKKRKRKIL